MRNGPLLGSALGGKTFKIASGAMAAGTVDIPNVDVRTGDLIMAWHEAFAGTPGHLSAAIQAAPGNDATVRVTSSDALDTSVANVLVVSRQSPPSSPAFQIAKSARQIGVAIDALAAGTVAANFQVASSGFNALDILMAFRTAQGAAPGFLTAAWTSFAPPRATVTSSNAGDDAPVGVLAIPCGIQPAGAHLDVSALSGQHFYAYDDDLVAGTIDIPNVPAWTGDVVIPFRIAAAGALGQLRATVQVSATPASPFGGTVRVVSSNAGDTSHVGCLVVPRAIFG